VVVLHHVVHADDVHLVKLRRGPRLPHRAGEQDLAILVAQPVRQPDLLDRDLAAQELVVRPPDGAHAAGTECGEQAVAATDLAGRGGIVHAVKVPRVQRTDASMAESSRPTGG